MHTALMGEPRHRRPSSPGHATWWLGFSVFRQACIDDPDTNYDPDELRTESTIIAVLAFLFLPGGALLFTLFLTRKTRVYRALGADFELVRLANQKQPKKTPQNNLQPHQQEQLRGNLLPQGARTIR